MKNSGLLRGVNNTNQGKVDDYPATIGLLGLGLTILLFNLYNAQLFPLDSLIFSMGIVYGGIGLVIIGLMEKKERNSFGAAMFFSYGFFWLSIAAFFTPFNSAPSSTEALTLASFFGLWGTFTTLLFFNTFQRNRALQLVFFSLALFLFLLAFAAGTGDATLAEIAEWEGIFCGLATIYTGVAQTINETYNRSVIPLGIMNK